MAKKAPPTRGNDLADRLSCGIRVAESALKPGARDLPILRGVNLRGEFFPGVENVLTQTVNILVESGRVYSFGEQVVMEKRSLDGTSECLVALISGGDIEGGAEDQLANLFVCAEGFGDAAIQFSPTKSLVDVLLRSESATSRLPRIRHYARIPVYDRDFVLRGPGWHPEQGILVHGPRIDPVPFRPSCRQGPLIDRLPFHLRTLLKEFCFTSCADLANAVGLMITGLLVNHFIESLKPIAALDGNQPGIGKTLFCRAVGVILGSNDPELVLYTADDEELAKRICAQIRDNKSPVLIIDNAKTRAGGEIESAVIESNSMSPVISLRILGQSRNYTRPNDVLWMLTMNGTRAKTDMVTRFLPIQLSYAGDPRNRQFTNHDPVSYARVNRLALLGELAGLVDNWIQRGRPAGDYQHRCAHWAHVIGGIMAAAGMPEFMANINEATTAFSSAIDEIAALAEAAVLTGGKYVMFKGESPATKE